MAEAEYFEKTPKRSNRWFVAFIVLSLLFGITFSLWALFNWLLFLGAVYSLFMSYFLLPVQPKIFHGRPNRPQGSQFNTGNRGAGGTAVQDPAAQRRKIIFIIVGGFIFMMVFIPFMIGVIEGLTEKNTDDYTASDEQSELISDPEDLSAQDYINSANDFFNNQKYDSAEKYYDRAIEVDPDNMEGYYGKGIVAYNKGNVDVANTYFLKAYEGGFRFAWLSWALADMYEKQGQTTRAITLYRESINLDSASTDSYRRLIELDQPNALKWTELAAKHPASN